MGLPGMPGLRRSSVTLSGLLNVIDGIGSEEGILFFATVSMVLLAIFLYTHEFALTSYGLGYRPIAWIN